MSHTLPLGLLAALLATQASAQTQVWATHATEKVRPNAAARALAPVRISAAGNEFEAFQVVVRGPATNVRATVSDLVGPSTIRGVRLYRQALINLRQASSLDGATGWFPDGLVPDVDEVVGERRNAFPFTVPTGESRAIWAEVHVPPDARPGEYSGEVRLTWDGGGSAVVPVTLTVWPFSLPSTASLKSAFGMSWGTLVSAHGASGAALSLLRQRYGQVALDHRVTVSKIDDGNRSLENYAAYYGPQFEGTAATRLSGARMTTIEYLGGTGGYASWASFFQARQWTERLYQYTCDEPPLTCAWSDIPARAAQARSANPPMRTLVTTSIQEADAKGVTSSIDVLVPVVNYLDDRPGSKYAGSRPKYDAFLARSPAKELWFYQSCMSHGCGGTVNFGSPTAGDQYYTGWPSYVIDTSAVRNRAMQWLAFNLRVTGELYYETTMAYTHDAWNNQWDFSGNGDGTLFYPGTPSAIGGSTHIPVASIRLKMIREGMEDYEYLRLLADLGDEPLARQIATTLFKSAYATEVPAADLLAARERIARRIVEIVGPVTGPDGGTGTDPGTGPGPDGGGTQPLVGAGGQGGGCSGARAGVGGGILALLGLAGALRFRRREP